ncbi:MAG: MarR family transcriptional regulator [Clostridia bacterium]|nr:MarR family transcriptional regulator [Clostridia bacterium]
MESKELILKTFKDSGKPLKTGEIVEISGVDKKEASKIIKELKEKEVIYSPKRCYYDIK